MDPSNNESGMQLPPIMEQTPAGMPPENIQPAVEQGMPLATERAPVTSQQAALPVAPLSLPVPPMPAAPQPIQTAVPSTTPTAALPLADDGDLIEKEWVDKAKQIVDQTRDDPYKQSEELTVVKADYMQKRYNKSIKLNK